MLHLRKNYTKKHRKMICGFYVHKTRFRRAHGLRLRPEKNSSMFQQFYEMQCGMAVRLAHKTTKVEKFSNRSSII